MKNCTCGVKFTGGLHSNWCDTLAPDEPEPDTLPSPAAHHGVWWTPDPKFMKLFGVMPHRTGLQPPAKPAPKATPGADGTRATDVICKCGAYIVNARHGYYDGQLIHYDAGCVS
jgi:hypothetical protein